MSADFSQVASLAGAPPLILPATELERFAAALLAAGGATPNDAAIVATSLLDADLCGHESHGVVRALEYVPQMAAGELVTAAPLVIENETASLIVADARRGFGQVQCRRMIDRLAGKAREHGFAGGTLRDCGHVGRLGEWVERLAELGMAGIVSVNDNGVLKCVAPPGGLDACLSTNPIAIGVPTGGGPPLVLDMSTSAVANGKIRVAQISGRECPPGWLQDADGHPTVDPAERFRDRPATILPMGGNEGYKGFGLSLLLDVLIGGLSGGQCPPAIEGSPSTNNVLWIVANPSLFAGESHFFEQARKLMDFVRHSRRKPGIEAIRLPGDQSSALRSQRRRDGVPVSGGTWQELTSLAAQFGVAPP